MVGRRKKSGTRFIVDRSGELSEWADILGKVYQRKVQIYTYANNHFEDFPMLFCAVVRSLRSSAARALLIFSLLRSPLATRLTYEG